MPTADPGNDPATLELVTDGRLSLRAGNEVSSPRGSRQVRGRRGRSPAAQRGRSLAIATHGTAMTLWLASEDGSIILSGSGMTCGFLICFEFICEPDRGRVSLGG